MAEIKISELSIGDWVRYRDADANVRVSDIYSNGYVFIVGEEDSGIGESVNAHHHIEPIPLTPEILEKNGFVKDEEFICHSLECDEADFVEYTIGMNRLYVKSGRCDIALTIKYVHQLQHALRLAGVEEEIKV